MREQARWPTPPYQRDLARLAAQIGGAAEVVARINANTRRVAEFLEHHPRVRQVWWARRQDERSWRRAEAGIVI